MYGFLKNCILLTLITVIQIQLSFAVDYTNKENQITKDKYWVIFRDKGSVNSYSNELLSKAIKGLPDRTIIRRQRAQGFVIDMFDLPVYQPYINAVLDCGAELCLTSRWLNGISIIADEKALKKISHLPYVDSIQKVASYKTRISRSARKTSVIRRAPSKAEISPEKDYGLSATQITQINVDAIHKRGYRGEGITIALLDTGFDLSHISLRNVRVLAQYDFINNDNETKDQPPFDDIGQDDHGTEVLSILAGYDQGNFVGVAYEANYLLAKTEKVSEEGIVFEKQIEEDWWVAGLEWAEQNGADIVSSSLGYTDWYTYKDMNGRTAKTTIAANIAVNKGLIVVVSAGNEGKSNEHPYISAPADGFDVVAVGSVNVDGIISEFSSIGPTYDGRIKPDLVAMGEGTYVADPLNTIAYRKVNGTSMATPLVAGTLALLKQALPEISKPKMLVKLLKFTASRSLNPDNRYGWGLINAESAYKYAKFPGSINELSEWDPMGSDSITKVFPNPIKFGQTLEIIGSKPIRSIRFYNLTGALVYQRRDLDEARYLTWNLKNDCGRKIASGVYVCIIEYINGMIESKRIAIIQ